MRAGLVDKFPDILRVDAAAGQNIDAVTCVFDHLFHSLCALYRAFTLAARQNARYTEGNKIIERFRYVRHHVNGAVEHNLGVRVDFLDFPDKIGATVGVNRAVRLQKAEDDAVRACI